MLGTIYVGLTGLDTYSKGLNNISNNVANLNTPGFKGSQMQFADLYYRNSDAGSDAGDARQQVGSGVGTAGTFLNFQQGEMRDTGNDLDLAIDGPGLFVLRKDGETTYSRAGQFQLDEDGFVIDKSTGARVAALDAAGALRDFSIAGLRASPPQASTKVRFNGNLSSSDTQHVVTSLTVYDPLGTPTVLKLTFDNTNASTAGSWRVTVADSAGSTLATGEIRFRNGRPDIGFDAVSFSFTPQGGQPQALTLDFTGDVTSFSAGTDSTLAVASQDGHAAGSLLKASFDEGGTFVLTYSNGQTDKQGRLALAGFSSTDGLEQVGSNQFVQRHGTAPQLGWAQEQAFGKVSARRVEMSNVDLSREFSEMIITQRGYQAASQVITTANEMMQQLLDMRGRR
jgi:flagellar hook protein FlgE